MNPHFFRRFYRKIHFLTFKLRRIHHGYIKNFLDYLDKYLLFKNLCAQIPRGGDIVECGVGMAITFQMLVYLNTGRTVWGFDSFEGFPEPTKEDSGNRLPQKGEWREVSVGETMEMIKEVVSNVSNLRIKEGFFQDTVPHYQGAGIALLHLDVDLYESYEVCLRHLFPKVVEGGVVVFDEYNEANWPGATQAINEYFKGTPYTIIKDPLSSKYYVKKSSITFPYQGKF